MVPIRWKSAVLQAIKQFSQEIGAPTSIIADMTGEKMSHDVRKFCNNIGTTLCALEEGTPWSNKAELYIGLLKEPVRDRIPSTTPGAEPPRDAKDSGSARSHSTHLETSSSNRP